MRPFAPALALLLAAAGCGRSGSPTSGGGGSDFPLPLRPRVIDPGESFVWHSWDVQIPDGVEALVLDSHDGVAAAMTFYIGGDDLSVQPGPPLSEWASVHPNAPQDAGTVRMEQGEPFPYAGKNLSARTPAEPGPEGVFDFQMHSRDGDQFVVAAFETPLPGHYVVSGLAAHLVRPGGVDAVALILLGSDPTDIRGGVVAENDMQWYPDDDGDTDLGTLPAGEHICFAAHPGAGDSALDDAMEIAFTITLTSD